MKAKRGEHVIGKPPTQSKCSVVVSTPAYKKAIRSSKTNGCFTVYAEGDEVVAVVEAALREHFGEK